MRNTPKYEYEKVRVGTDDDDEEADDHADDGRVVEAAPLAVEDRGAGDGEHGELDVQDGRHQVHREGAHRLVQVDDRDDQRDKHYHDDQVREPEGQRVHVVLERVDRALDRDPAITCASYGYWDYPYPSH